MQTHNKLLYHTFSYDITFDLQMQEKYTKKEWNKCCILQKGMVK